MAVNITSHNSNFCHVGPITDVPKNITAINDNALIAKPTITAYIRNETSLSKRLVAFLFDTIFIGILYVMTYNFFMHYQNQIIVHSLYFLYPYFYYVCIPTLSKGTIGMLIMHLRCVRSDGEKVEFIDYHHRFFAVHFFMVIALMLSAMTYGVDIKEEFLEVVHTLKIYSSMAYGFWFGLGAISLLLSPLKRGLYEKLSRTMIISFRMHQ